MKKKKRSKRLIQSRGSIRNEEPRGTRSSFDYWTWMCNAASSLPIEASISSAQYLGSPLRPYYFSEPFLFFDIFHLLLFFSFSFFNILVPRNIRSHDVGPVLQPLLVVSHFNVIRGSSYLSNCIRSKVGSIFVFSRLQFE